VNKMADKTFGVKVSEGFILFYAARKLLVDLE
jgi:hypothetical protein